jgi:hypothetical protein
VETGINYLQATEGHNRRPLTDFDEPEAEVEQRLDRLCILVKPGGEAWGRRMGLVGEVAGETATARMPPPAMQPMRPRMQHYASPPRKKQYPPSGLENVFPHSWTRSDAGSGRVSFGNSPHFAARMPARWESSGSSSRTSGPVADATSNLRCASRVE